MTKIRFAKNQEDWLAVRKKFITGTEVGTIIGCNEYETIEELVKKKTGEVSDESKKKNTFLMDLGRRFEDKLANIYKDWHQNPYYISACGKFMATCDFVSKDEEVLIELKTTTSEKQFNKLINIPDQIRCQISHQYICSGAKFKEVYLICYLINKKSEKLKSIYLKLDNLPKEYPKEIANKLEAFYNKCIVRDDRKTKDIF